MFYLSPSTPSLQRRHRQRVHTAFERLLATVMISVRLETRSWCVFQVLEASPAAAVGQRGRPTDRRIALCRHVFEERQQVPEQNDSRPPTAYSPENLLSYPPTIPIPTEKSKKINLPRQQSQLCQLSILILHGMLFASLLYLLTSLVYD
jgi:hypothetical protein